MGSEMCIRDRFCTRFLLDDFTFTDRADIALERMSWETEGDADKFLDGLVSGHDSNGQ